MTDRALSPPALAEKLRVKPQKVLGWIKDGQLKAVNVAESRAGRPRWRILPEAIEEFLTARSSTPESPEPRRRRRREVGKRRYYQ